MLTDVQVKGDDVIVNGVKAEKLLYSKKNSPTGYAGCMKSAVLFTDDYVVKFGGSEFNVLIEPKDEPHFAKVVYVSIDKSWYVQKRVKCEKFAPVTPAQSLKARRLATKYGIGDISTYLPDEKTHGHKFETGHNFTINNDGIVQIFDYDRYCPNF